LRRFAPLLLVTLTLSTSVSGSPSDAARRRSCRGFTATITGTPRADVLFGTPHRDVIVGRAGIDTILALGGRDIVCGREGADTINGGRGGDVGNGGRGADDCVNVERTRSCQPHG
jgi:Ca2+-binding RTX toxin-like protein